MNIKGILWITNICKTNRQTIVDLKFNYWNIHISEVISINTMVGLDSFSINWVLSREWKNCISKVLCLNVSHFFSVSR